ncbi:hypothetical protein KP509_1Z219400, partial [Ceratopteris richardii]
MCKVQRKVNIWHASQWPLHVRIRIVPSFLQPYIMYYLLLLDWKKCHLYAFDCSIKNFLWNKAHNRALVYSSWDFVCQPKSKGGLGILHLHSHMMERRAAFIMRITSAYKPLWTDIFWRIIDNVEVYYKDIWKLHAWNKFFSHAPLQTSSVTLSMLVVSFKKTPTLLKWNGGQRYVGNSFALISPYWSFVTNPPLAYSLVPLSIDASDPLRDWLFAKHSRWWNGAPRTFYLSLVHCNDITSQCNFRWKMSRTQDWWTCKVCDYLGFFFTFKMKVFIWRISVGHFTLGAFLSKHGIQGVRCPHCASYAETMRHALWTC